jgi:uncharacterized protein (DUF1697 family)
MSTGAATTYVALLRGINVGGSNLIKMSELVRCFEALGYRDVKTYINTGNVIFTATAGDPAELEAEIEGALEQRLPYAVRVFVRDRDQIRALIETIDSIWTSDAGQRQTVIFLARGLDGEAALEGIQPNPQVEIVHHEPGAILWAADKRSLSKSGMFKLNRMPVYQSMSVRSANTTRRIYQLMRRQAS